MASTGLRSQDQSQKAEPVAVSFSELFFDLALVSSTARLSEYVRHDHEVHFDFRFVSCLFGFWYIWHSTNLIYNFTEASTTSPFRNVTLFVKLVAVLTMSSCVVEEPTLEDDKRFMRSYVAARIVDCIIYARLYYLSQRDGFVSSVSYGLMANGASNLIESVIWITCSETISSQDDLIKAMFAAQVFSYVVLRTCTQKIWRHKSSNRKQLDLSSGITTCHESEGEKEEEENKEKIVAFDFNHFRERQGLLVILVLGESIMSSVLTEENRDIEGVTTTEQYTVAYFVTGMSFLLKNLYIDSPSIEEFTCRVTAIEGGVERTRKRLPTSWEMVFFVLYAPLHALILGSVTCTAASFKLLLDSDEVEQSVVKLLCFSSAVTITSTALLRRVKYDTPAFDVYVEITRFDLRIVSEYIASVLLFCMGFFEFGRLSCVVTVFVIMLGLVAWENIYTEWVLRMLERKVGREALGEVDTFGALLIRK